MKKITLLLITALFSSLLLRAQHCSNTINVTTTDWRKAGTVNTWDWTQTYYNDAYIFNRPLPSTVHSPFYPGISSPNPNLFTFHSAFSQNGLNGIDFHPEDGWELLIKDFGSCPNPPCNNATAVTNPYFMLYNRYTAIIRAFVLITSVPTTPQNGATMKLSLAPGRQNALLSFANPIVKPVESFAKYIEMSNPNYYVNQNDYWLYSDFIAAYDPCICNYPSYVRLEVQLVQDASIRLEGTLAGTSRQIIASAPGNVSTSTGFKAVLDFAGATYKVGKKAYTEWNGYKNETDKFINEQAPWIESDLDIELGKFKDFTTFLPYVGTLAGLYDFITAGGKEKQTPASPTPMAFETNLEFNATGTINIQAPFLSSTFNTPGSNTNISAMAPVYNNLLGVFNVLYNPKMEYVDYENWENSYTDEDGNTHALNFLPRIRQYKVKDPIKFVLNPAANLDIISIDATVVMKYHVGVFADEMDDIGLTRMNKPVEFGPPSTLIPQPTLLERYNKAGFEFNQWPKNFPNNSDNIELRTPYVPLQCFNATSFCLYNDAVNGFDAEPDLYCKLLVKLKRKDGLGQDVLLVVTYPFEMIAPPEGSGNNFYHLERKPFEPANGHILFPTTLDANGSGSAKYPMPLLGIPYDRFYANTTIPGDVFAWNHIEINNWVTIPSGTTVTAGKSIDILDGNDFYPDVEFKIGYPLSDCYNDVMSLHHTDPEISHFCRLNGPYENHSRFKGSPEDEPHGKTSRNATEYAFNVYPNPFNTFTNIYYTIPFAKTDIEINIVDITGRKIHTIERKEELAGSYQIPFDPSKIPAGIYFCTFTTNNGYSVTRKLVLAK